MDIELTKQEAGAINTYIRKNLKKGGYDMALFKKEQEEIVNAAIC